MKINFGDFFQSKNFKIIIFVLAVFAVLLFVFKVGMSIGYRKANFSFQWGENYHRNFGGPANGFMRDFRGSDFMNSHGIVGQIIKIDTSTLIIKGKDNLEKIVALKDDTAILRNRDNVKSSDLKINDMVVIIGQPNQAGQVEAKFIRLMPAPPARGFSSSTNNK